MFLTGRSPGRTKNALIVVSVTAKFKKGNKIAFVSILTEHSRESHLSQKDIIIQIHKSSFRHFISSIIKNIATFVIDFWL